MGGSSNGNAERSNGRCETPGGDQQKGPEQVSDPQMVSADFNATNANNTDATRNSTASLVRAARSSTLSQFCYGFADEFESDADVLAKGSCPEGWQAKA